MRSEPSLPRIPGIWGRGDSEHFEAQHLLEAPFLRHPSGPGWIPPARGMHWVFGKSEKLEFFLTEGKVWRLLSAYCELDPLQGVLHMWGF